MRLSQSWSKRSLSFKKLRLKVVTLKSDSHCLMHIKQSKENNISFEDKGDYMFWLIEILFGKDSGTDEKVRYDSFDREFDRLTNWYFDNHVLR